MGLQAAGWGENNQDWLGSRPREVWEDSLLKKHPVVSHTENWESADGFGYSDVTGDLDFGEQLWIRTGDKSLTRFGPREDGEVEHKEQRTPNCFVSALGLPLTVYILPRRLESEIKLQPLMFPLQSLLSIWRMLTLTILNTPVHSTTIYNTS